MEDANLNTVTRWGRVPAWWLLHPEIDSDRFALLAALATYADDKGACTPSQSTLARRLKRSRPWINRVVSDLVRIGLLHKTMRKRSNGGTTSCEYIVRFTPPEESRGDTRATGACPLPDRACHEADRNQAGPEQNQEARPEARASVASNSVSNETEEVPGLDRDWQPSAEARGAARRLYPDANLVEHTALFVARCRAKGYRISASNADDTWLSWLIEDQRKSRNHREAPAGQPRSWKRPPSQSSSYDRLAAWGAAAEELEVLSPRDLT